MSRFRIILLRWLLKVVPKRELSQILFAASSSLYLEKWGDGRWLLFKGEVINGITCKAYPVEWMPVHFTDAWAVEHWLNNHGMTMFGTSQEELLIP